IEMPVVDGFTALKELKESDRTANIPVIFLSAYDSDEVEALGLELGAVDFIVKPFSPPVLKKRVARHLQINEQLNKREKQLFSVHDNILEIYADTVENRDKTIGRHLERIARYMEFLIKSLIEKGFYTEELNRWDINAVVYAARLHDVGKIAISEEILNKPGNLTRDEYNEIKKHSIEGEKIIERVIAKTGETPYLRHAKRIAGSHHERWDGSGYPRGLSGEDIPLEGRILAIVDVFDALMSKRPYKGPYSQEESMRQIWKEANKYFDPTIVGVFSEVMGQYATWEKEA
ncbi:MAG: HD domain-containing protein, partial [Oscillospiraceae bacterium]|nr:HD domain-containing protein [Oscillospiraceae bacterium]